MQNIMNKILITTTIPLVFIALSGVANATVCNASEVKVLSDNCHQRDKGYKPHTSCIATITAPNHYFILNREVSRSTAGSSHELKPAIYNSTPYNHTAIKNSPVFKEMLLQSASVTARCRRGGDWRMFKTCHARAKIVAKAYPHKCLKAILQKIIDNL